MIPHRQIAQIIFDELVKCPLGTRKTTAQMAYPYIDKDDLDILWDIDIDLCDIVRKDGRFILDSSHHIGKTEGLPFNLDFILLRNNLYTQDKLANDFAIANGKYGAYFGWFWEQKCIYNEIVNDRLDESDELIVVDREGKVWYKPQQDYSAIPYEDNPFPWGKSIFDEYKRKVLLGNASPYEREIVDTCDSLGYDQPLEENNIYRALEEAEFLGMKVAIVPDPDFQPGGRREGQLDGWSYHPEVVSVEEYDRMTDKNDN